MKTDDLIEAPIFETITLNKIRFAIAKHVYPLDLRYHKQEDYMTGAMVHMLNWNLLGKTIDTHTHPRTWWDGFKNKYFPKWLKKRYPPSFETFKLWNICPHINIAFPKNQGLHFDWIDTNHGWTPTEVKTSDEIINDIIGAYRYTKERGHNDLSGFGMAVYVMLAQNNLIQVNKNE